MKLPVILAGALLAAVLRAASPAPERVVVVANADDPDSLAIARHYLEARKIPGNNLVALPLPAEERISWDVFVSQVRNPLARALADKGFLKGDFDPAPDAEGRLALHTSENNVDFLVLCRGVPLKIANDPARFEAREKDLVKQPQFAVNHASVDSELAVLPRPGTPLAGFVQNPWYEKSDPPAASVLDTLRVARLDGPTADDANRLVDRALEAERTGLLGRAYIDEGGPHAKGDRMLEETGSLCVKAGFDTTFERTRALIGEEDRFDAPALYFGWYSQNIAGAPAAPEFRFPPGAIAIHIHSFSATTLRDPARGWTGPLVAHGVTATVGNVEEPYLELTHNPTLFLLALTEGRTAGEAAAFANPVLSWQTIFVGDPLYRPFAHDLPEQLADLGRQVDAGLAYAVLRVIRKQDSEGAAAQADRTLAAAFARMPVLALAREILDREIAAKKTPTFSTARLAGIPENPGLVFETAAKLTAAGRYSEAGALLEKQEKLGVRLPRPAAGLATRLGRTALAARLAKLYPPPPPAPTAPPKAQ